MVKTIENIHRPRSEKGPVILCVDTSSSMSGEPERIAKSLVVQTLDMVRKQKRRCFLITYSIRSRTIELTRPENWRELEVFLSMVFTGGTDGEMMFRDVFKALDSEDFSLADVLIVSDFKFSLPISNTLRRIEEDRAKGTRFYGLVVGYDSWDYKQILDKMWQV